LAAWAELINQCRRTPQSPEDQRNWYCREPGPDDLNLGPGGQQARSAAVVRDLAAVPAAR